jgi:hypothetical protein
MFLMVNSHLRSRRLLAAVLVGCVASIFNLPAPHPTVAMANTQTNQNPLLAEWAGPYGGVPPFDRVRVEHFKPALEAAMAENLAEVERIASNTAPP